MFLPIFFYTIVSLIEKHLFSSMQSWKRKKNSYSSKKVSLKKWPANLLAIFFLLLTLFLAVYHFPKPWNNFVGSDSFLAVQETPFRLGLDLQGGTHLVYQADMSQISDQEQGAALEGVRDVVERRVNAFGVSEPLVQTTSSGGVHRVIVELAGVLDVNEAIGQIGETPILEFKEASEEVYEQEATPEDLATLEEKNNQEKETAQAVLNRAISGESFDGLVDEFKGNSFPTITENHPQYGFFVEQAKKSYLRAGQVLPVLVENEQGFYILRLNEIVETKRMNLSHLLVCFEGKSRCQNPIPAIEASVQIEKAKQEISADNFAQVAETYSTDPGTKETGGDLGWVEPGTMVSAFELAALQTPVGEISNVVETEFGYHLILKKAEESVSGYQFTVLPFARTQLTDIVAPSDPWKNTQLSGKQLKRSSVQFDQNTGTPYVTLEFDKEGADLFAEITERNVGQYVAIFLDGEAISVPVVNQAIYGGEAIIQGDFSVEEAKLLAQRLNAGALPVPIELLSQQTIGPTLGKISLEQSINAAWISLVLIALFMVLFYRLSGLVAIIALIFYGFLNLTFYKFFGVTITLAGIAGFVLSLGIAVDANVLIFERLKEEIKAGRDLRSATDEAFKRAWPSIRDGNYTTLIASLVLYGFSSSFIKGFALTLSIGVLVSMFTAIVITKAYLRSVHYISFLRKRVFYGNLLSKEDQS